MATLGSMTLLFTMIINVQLILGLFVRKKLEGVIINRPMAECGRMVATQLSTWPVFFPCFSLGIHSYIAYIFSKMLEGVSIMNRLMTKCFRMVAAYEPGLTSQMAAPCCTPGWRDVVFVLLVWQINIEK